MENNNDDLERIQLLDIIYHKGLSELSMQELERLYDLIEKKDYGHNSKAQKSKKKILKQIGIAIYDMDTKYGNSFKIS